FFGLARTAESPDSFRTSEFGAVDGQTAPYPSLAVRARNGRVADNPLVSSRVDCCGVPPEFKKPIFFKPVRGRIAFLSAALYSLAESLLANAQFVNAL
ncbi:MAG TPA: hypothetical protein VI386_20190, partial [Candidatus Sulfotelmatobacter sp.]